MQTNERTLFSSATEETHFDVFRAREYVLAYIQSRTARY